MKTQRFFLFVTLLLVSSLLSFAKPDEEPTEHDRIYYLQHKLIPRWLFESDGMFYKELNAGIPKHLADAAREIVSEKYAEKLSVENIQEFDGFLIVFREPSEVPECFYVIAANHNGDFRYYTLEKAEDIMKRGVKSVVGEWTSEGVHINLGARTFTDKANFIEAIAVIRKKD